MRVFAEIAFLIGVFMMIIAGLSFLELSSVARSMTSPPTFWRPLTTIFCPELFDADKLATKPDELVGIGFNRIYMTAGASLALSATAAFLLITGKQQNRENRFANRSEHWNVP